MEGFGANFVKFGVFFCNFLVFVVGVVIFGVSLAAALNADFEDYLQKLMDKSEVDIQIESVKAGLYVLVAIGVFLACVGFLGCCGAWCENRFLLGLFFVILLLLAIIEFAGAIAVLTKKDTVENEVRRAITESINNIKNGNLTDKQQKEAEDELKEIQKTFKCCGVNGTAEAGLPSCTAEQEKQGCVDALWDSIWLGLKVAGIIAIIAIIVEILAMVFSCFLCGAIKKAHGYEQYA